MAVGSGLWAPGSMHKLWVPVPSRDLEGTKFGAEGLGWAPELLVLALGLEALASRLRCSCIDSPRHEAEAVSLGTTIINCLGGWLAPAIWEAGVAEMASLPSPQPGLRAAKWEAAGC